MNKKLLLATALFFSIASAECPFSKNKSTNKLTSFLIHSKRIGRCGARALYKKPLCGVLTALGVLFKRKTLCKWPLIVPSLLVGGTLTHEFLGNICTEYNLDYENDHKPIFTFILGLASNEQPEILPPTDFDLEETTEEEVIIEQEETIVKPEQTEDTPEEIVPVEQQEEISEPVTEEEATEDVQRSAEITQAIQELLVFAEQLQKHEEAMELQRTQVPNPEEPETDEDADGVVEVVIAPR